MKDGTMLFGGTQGLTHFRPEQIIATAPPLTVITGCKLFGKPIEKVFRLMAMVLPTCKTEPLH